MREHIEMRIQIAPEVAYFTQIAEYFWQAMWGKSVPASFTQVKVEPDSFFQFTLAEFQSQCKSKVRNKLMANTS
jgi:hypothetical protein